MLLWEAKKKAKCSKVSPSKQRKVSTMEVIKDARRVKGEEHGFDFRIKMTHQTGRLEFAPTHTVCQ